MDEMANFAGFAWSSTPCIGFLWFKNRLVGEDKVGIDNRLVERSKFRPSQILEGHLLFYVYIFGNVAALSVRSYHGLPPREVHDF